ncbi:hypothetical protein BC834DRAFT_265893 [Gloeopeniophorella convolvens]|nr:hypothetical protein BC834DRAFT_265893 [Gloeopeniophorella convolvens]
MSRLNSSPSSPAPRNGPCSRCDVQFREIPCKSAPARSSAWICLNHVPACVVGVGHVGFHCAALHFKLEGLAQGAGAKASQIRDTRRLERVARSHCHVKPEKALYPCLHGENSPSDHRAGRHLPPKLLDLPASMITLNLSIRCDSYAVGYSICSLLAANYQAVTKPHPRNAVCLPMDAML